MNTVAVLPGTRKHGAEHTSAVRRLPAARDEQSRLDALSAAAPLALERLSAGRADVAAREQWLHWVDEGESLEPWADGEWAPRDPAHERGAPGGLSVIRQRISQGENDLRHAVALRLSERSSSTEPVLPK